MDVTEIISKLIPAVAGVLWALTLRSLKKRDEERAEERQSFLRLNIEKEDRQSREIESLKDEIKKLESRVDALVLEYQTSSARHSEVIAYLREFLAKVEKRVDTQDKLLEEYGRVIFRK
jgi:septal ring factor EnvC (AmiA/AmiB activator)